MGLPLIPQVLEVEDVLKIHSILMGCCLCTHHMHLLYYKEMKTRQTFILLKAAITKISDDFSIFSEQKITEKL